MSALIVCLALLLPYALWTVACSVALMRRRRLLSAVGNSAGCPVTAIVCTFRERRETVARCLASIVRAMGTDDRLIVITDHTPPDVTAWLADTWQADSRVTITANTAPQGKKHAQGMAVALARTETIVAIDADCQVGPHFFDTIRHAAPPSDFMLLLPVAMRGCGFVGKMMEMEFVCLQVITSGSAILGRPTMANGAGMVFSRPLYMGHNPRHGFRSGDDMFLLGHAIATGAKVDYLADAVALVETSAPSSVRAYVRQRARWLGKAGGYSPTGGHGAVILLAWSVLAGVVAWPLAGVLAAFGLMGWGGAVAIFAIKLALDAFTFIAGRRMLRSDAKAWLALPLEVAYPLMTAIVGLRAAFFGRRGW